MTKYATIINLQKKQYNSPKWGKKTQIILIGTTNPKGSGRACRTFEPLSPLPHQKLEEKLARVQKRAYLCSVKIKETTPDATTKR